MIGTSKKYLLGFWWIVHTLHFHCAFSTTDEPIFIVKDGVTIEVPPLLLILEIRPVSWGPDQQVADFNTVATRKHIQETTRYMLTQSDETRHRCQARHHFCSFWAALGECEAFPSYMNDKCAPNCQACHESVFRKLRFHKGLQHPQGLSQALHVQGSQIASTKEQLSLDDATCLADSNDRKQNSSAATTTMTKSIPSHNLKVVETVPVNWGPSQHVYHTWTKETQRQIFLMNKYMAKETVAIRKHCPLMHSSCSYWAARGWYQNLVFVDTFDISLFVMCWLPLYSR